MAVLEVVQSNLVDYVAGPATAETGISEGDPTAGTHSPVGPDDLNRHPMSTTDRAGAAIMTVMVCIMVIGTMLWLVVGD